MTNKVTWILPSALLSLAIIQGCSSDSDKVDSYPIASKHIAFVANSESINLKTAEQHLGTTVLSLSDNASDIHLSIEEAPYIYLSSVGKASSNSDLKATLSTTDNLDEFYLFAYSYSNSQTWSSVKSSVTTMDEGANIKLQKTLRNGTSVWESELLWPEINEKLTTMSYSPAVSSSNGMTLNTTAAIPSIDLEIPDSEENQADIIVAQTEEATILADQTALPATFLHALVPLQFQINNNLSEDITITKIALANMYYKGSLSLDQSSWTDNEYPWTVSSEDRKEFTVSLPSSSLAAGSSLKTNDQLLMMLPCSSLNGVSVVVYYTRDGEEKSVSLNLPSSLSWPRGKQYTATLNFGSSANSSYDWNIELSDFTASGADNSNTGTFTIQSSRTANGSTTPIPFIVEYSTDGGSSWTSTAPSWISGLSNGEGTTTSTTSQSFTLAANTAKENPSNITNTLRNASSLGSESNPYILGTSTQTGGSYDQVANTYIISAPGWYAIPPYYGNTNVVENFINTANFVNSRGHQFRNANITEDMQTTASASITGCQLINQDVDGLVSNLSLTTIGSVPNYVKFYVNPSNIKEGNAVVAINSRASGDNWDQVAWSWNIWVRLPAKDITLNSGDLSIMNVPLGFCHKDTTSLYEARPLQVRFTQTQGNTAKPFVFELNQTEVVNTLWATNNFYQWGRKDPLFGMNKNNSTAKESLKDIYGFGYTFNYNSTINDFYILINHPDWFYLANGSYYSSSNVSASATLWSSTAKTVLDPSPYGYRVPSESQLSTLLGNVTNDKSSSITLNGTQVLPYTGYITNEYWSSIFGLYLWSSSLQNSNTAVGISLELDPWDDIISTGNKSSLYTVLPVVYNK